MNAAQYGPWAVIAGASEGVGEAFAHQLADAGINLVLIARNEQALDRVAEAVRAQNGVEVRVLSLDLTSPDMLALVRAATDDLEVGLVVYNAGASHGMGRFLDAPMEASLQLVRLNAVGQVSLAHHFGRGMAARGRGGILLIGSLAGNAGAATIVPYAAAKAFTQILAEGLWSELKPHGVDVLCVVLGATDTPARARLGMKDDPGQIVSSPEDVARESLAAIADGPVLVPTHLASACQHFCAAPRRQAAEEMTSMILGFKQ
jgi:short-subunit dehydrogenase